MGKPPQTGFNTANENGNILVGLPDQIAVNDGSIVRTLAHNAAGSKGIGLSLALGNGVMVDHRIHIAAADQEA